MEHKLNYFAYGSNMLTRRLVDRVPSANPVGKASLEGFTLAWNKLSLDESGKCTIQRSQNGIVWGVLFEIDAGDLQRLHDFEGYPEHYYADDVRVSRDGKNALAFAYIARPEKVVKGLAPYTWYKAYVVEGAKEHALAPEYVASLEAQKAIHDPNKARQTRETRNLGRWLGH